jgi:hypothetical protein
MNLSSSGEKLLSVFDNGDDRACHIFAIRQSRRYTNELERHDAIEKSLDIGRY